MAPQVTRISMAFGCVIFAFVGYRSIAVPASFGKLGHYRADALAMVGSHQQKYEGKQPCIDCHANNTPHTDHGVSCETCHGPGAAHTKDFDSSKVKVDTSRTACGRCHAMNSARRASFPQIDMNDHHPSQRCVECHKIHPEEATKTTPTASEPAAATTAIPTAAPSAAPAPTPTTAKPVEATKPAATAKPGSKK